MGNFKLNRIFLIILLVLSCVVNSGAQLSKKDIIRQNSSAVVAILSFDKNDNALSLGSGFIISHSGLIITNYHVIRGAHKVAVKIKDGDVYWVRGVVELDDHRDFVILKIASYSLPEVKMGNSNIVEIGDEIIAIGNPKGLEHTVSDGIISQIRSDSGYKLFQITAPISSGSSGGPLINMNGKVIGITTSSIEEGQSLNFALPINYIHGAIQSGVSVKYTLEDIALTQDHIDKELMEEATEKFISELFALHEDPDNFFSMVYPKAWKVERSDGWTDENSSYVNNTMFAPYDAYRAEINGYLSEGIRVSFELPPKGYIWEIGSFEEFAESYKSGLIASNPGFALTDSISSKIGDQPAEIFSMVGQNENIPEPEKTTFILVANENYKLLIEFVSPTSKLQDYKELYLTLFETFKLSSSIKLK